MSQSPLPDSNRRPLPYHPSSQVVGIGACAAETLPTQGALDGFDLRSDGPVGTHPVPAAFGYWLSGFIDGEGCFTIYEHSKKANRNLNSYVVRFTLCVRDDDRAILDEIVDCTGIGKVYAVKGTGTSRPQATWHVTRKSDSAALVRLLDAYPLRAKKARDYKVWREAVSAWQRGDTTQIAALRDVLVNGRAYRPGSEDA